MAWNTVNRTADHGADPWQTRVPDVRCNVDVPSEDPTPSRGRRYGLKTRSYRQILLAGLFLYVFLCPKNSSETYFSKCINFAVCPSNEVWRKKSLILKVKYGCVSRIVSWFPMHIGNQHLAFFHFSIWLFLRQTFRIWLFYVKLHLTGKPRNFNILKKKFRNCF